MPAEVSSSGENHKALGPATMNRQPRVLTLIVATTKDLGIGKDGGLPWPQLKQEMGYFARVTKRQPTTISGHIKSINAVVMGRKTWDSIPTKFRPLKGRLNVVISRSMKHEAAHDKVQEWPMVVGSLESAMHALQTQEEDSRADNPLIGDVFVIGGSSIYDSALALPEAKRVLLTKIKNPEYACDTYFPLNLDAEQAKDDGWRKKSWTQLVDFAGGEAVVGGQDVMEQEGCLSEGEVNWEYCLYERP
jgi:dihydrofolate reductase